jgi:hypothetical protein
MMFAAIRHDAALSRLHPQAAVGHRLLKNVATLFGGQEFLAVLPLVTAPILGRLFTPNDYGLLGA